MNRQRGFTIVEMLVVISISTVMMGIAAVMLHALLKYQNSGRDHLQYSRNINRLAEQFRQDVHATREISAGGKEGIMEILPDLADGITIRWQCLAERMERSEQRGNKIIRRESYLLPPATQAELQLQSQPDASVARILITPKQQTSELFRTPAMRIETLVGLDSRLAKIPAAAEAKP